MPIIRFRAVTGIEVRRGRPASIAENIASFRETNYINRFSHEEGKHSSNYFLLFYAL